MNFIADFFDEGKEFQPPHHPHLTPEGYWDNQGARRLVIYSGAGLSVESGMAAFNVQNGLWENHKIEEVCHGATWRHHRELVEGFYGARSVQNEQAQPHAGHVWCAEAEHAGAVLVTQNVDTLLEKAGARHVRHLHGRIDERRCWHCSMEWKSPRQTSKVCPICRSLDTRVNVVFYQEMAPEYPLASRTLGGLRPQDVLVVVGTKATVANPLRWLTGKTQVWVVDPDPSPALLSWPGVKVWKEPATRLAETVGQAWADLKP
jgi:NAD-dependent deacetylase